MLSINEITTGTIAYFDIQSLNGDSRIKKFGTVLNNNTSDKVTTRPFVCYKATSSKTFWSPLSSVERKERLLLKSEWVINSIGKLNGKTFLQDGKNAYVGDVEAFIDASVKEVLLGARPRINEAGIREILKSIAQRNGPLYV